jgi:hypothetical protein
MRSWGFSEESLPPEDGSLDGNAAGDCQVRVSVLARLFPEEILQVLLHRWYARGAANEDDLVDLALGELGILMGGYF